MVEERLTNAPPPDPRLHGLSDDLHTLPPGSRVGRYEIEHAIGQGGFGITYRARDTRLNRDVAVKEYMPGGFSVRRADGTVLARSTQAAETFLWGRERFVDEARTLARLENASGIVNVHDIVEANGTAYMIMEFLRGETLEARLKRDGRLPQPAVERLLYPLLDGLEQVHAADFLHRDIKPANILVDATGLPKLIDFGASRMAVQGRTQALTAIYTPGYAAPEQMTLSGKQGPWTDLYALGATLYHCVAGVAPTAAIDRMIGDKLVPAAEAGMGRYAPGLLAAIDVALALRPEDRPRSIAAWRSALLGQPAALMTAPTGLATRRTDGQGASTPKPGGTSKPVWLAIGVAVLCLAGGGLYAWRSVDRDTARQADRTTARAEAESRRQAAEDKARAEAEVVRRAEESARIADDAAWTRAGTDGTPRALRDYIERYPAGRHVKEARALLVEVERRHQEASAAAADDAAWAPAKAAGSAAALKGYLVRFPSGRHAAEARAMISEIERREEEPKARDCPVCPEMVRIPPGSFVMGAAPGEHDREKVPMEFRAEDLPRHRVSIGYPFSIGKYEVTRAEFAAFVQATGHRTAADWRNPGFTQSDRDPVVNVGWNDAKAYVSWLAMITGKRYRLPSEAEWEYAARAGTTTARYWGDRPQDACRYANVEDASHGCVDGHGRTAPVGSFRPNAFGLHDVLGNVWEWTEDCWNDSYVGAPADGSAWDRGDCGSHVIRGGGWYYGPWSVRAANRGKYSIGLRTEGFGLRVARTD